jgi:hypothetical protein
MLGAYFLEPVDESWPKLKAFVDGANIEMLLTAVQSGEIGQVRSLLHARPDLVGMDRSGGDEHRLCIMPCCAAIQECVARVSAMKV